MKKIIQALILDIDNTLLDQNGQLTSASRQAIAQAQKADIQVILATARGYRSTEPVWTELNLRSPVVCHVGAMVYDYKWQRPLQSWPLPPLLTRRLTFLAQELDIRLSAYVGDEVWFNKEPAEDLRPDWVVKTDFVRALDKTIALEMVVVDEPAVSKMLEAIKASPWQNELFLGHMEENGRTWLFITRAGINKATALDWLLPRLGLSWQVAAACGDSVTDLEMIQKAKWGLAAPLASPDIQAAHHASFYLDVNEPIAHLVQEILRQRRNINSEII